MDLIPQRQHVKDSMVKRPVRILVLAMISNAEVELAVSGNVIQKDFEVSVVQFDRCG
jgi:hypothetical protein